MQENKLNGNWMAQQNYVLLLTLSRPRSLFSISRVIKFREDYDSVNKNFAQLKNREEQVN